MATPIMPIRLSVVPLAVLTSLLLLAGCKGKASGLGEATTDTLPGGIVRTISDLPVGWADSSSGWHLVLDHTIQPGEGEPGELFDPSDLAMNDAGQVFIRDQNPSIIKVYDASGAFLKTIGHEGDGPGEFRTAFLAAHGDTLAAQDPQNSRVTSFRVSDGSVISTWRSTCCFWYPVSRDGAGRLVLYSMGQPDSGSAPAQSFVRGHFDGSGIDTAWVTERPSEESKSWVVHQGKDAMFRMPVPLQPRDLHAVDPAGGFISGWNGQYLLWTSRNGRDTTSLFGRKWTAPSVSSAERDALVEKAVKNRFGGGLPESVLREAFVPSYIPDTRPAFNAIEADQLGNRWIRLEIADTLAVHYDVFDPGGRWLGGVSTPAAGWSGPYQPPAWGRDRVAVLSEDEEGKPRALIYRIERGASR